MEAVTIDDASGDRDLDDVMQKEHAGRVTARAGLGPRLSAAAALMARQPDRRLERDGHAAAGIADRHADTRVPPRRWLVHEEPSADAIPGEGDRREDDEQFL